MAGLAAALGGPGVVPGGPPVPVALAAPAAAAGAVPAAGGAAACASVDSRILLMEYDTLGQRHGAFREALNAMTEPAWTDFPSRGPRTCLWMLRRFMEANGGTPLGRHARWRAEARLQPGEVGVDEHERACRQLELMCLYDQLNVPALAAGKLMARVVQMHEERYRDRMAPNVDQQNVDAHVILGSDLMRGNVCVCPKLVEHLKDQLMAEWSVAKERRKAREERELARPKPKGGKKGKRDDDVEK